MTASTNFTTPGFNPFSSRRQRDSRTLGALHQSLAIIEFTPDGVILDANDNFLSVMQYTREEIVGRHHSIFVDPRDAESGAYADFWRELAAGRFQSAEFRRVRKDGEDVWIQATYNPVTNGRGQVERVVKLAADVTERKLSEVIQVSKVEAMSRSQAVIEFMPDGTIVEANENFCQAMGYQLDEIVGQHHSIFVAETERTSDDYRKFWEALGQGEYFNAEFRRIDKAGEDVWIFGSYNPILNADGDVIRVVKFASDITEAVTQRKTRETALSEINAEIGSIAAGVSQTASRANEMAAASEQSGASVQGVASGIEELAASSKEIAEQIQRATSVTRTAVDKARSTSELMSQLSDTAKAVGDIVTLINGIAEQTNLLALNATIEAARAGEAGKGFAVVASEVKDLANQASKATENISSQIDAIQSVAGESVTAIGEIDGAIREIDEVSSSVASAVEEQNVVTSDLSATMQQVAGTVGQMSDGVREVAESAKSMDAATDSLRAAAEKVA